MNGVQLCTVGSAAAKLVGGSTLYVVSTWSPVGKENPTVAMVWEAAATEVVGVMLLPTVVFVLGVVVPNEMTVGVLAPEPPQPAVRASVARLRTAKVGVSRTRIEPPGMGSVFRVGVRPALSVFRVLGVTVAGHKVMGCKILGYIVSGSL